MLRLFWLITVGFALLHSISFSQHRLQTRDVITGLWVPWEIAWGPDNTLWVTERPGMVSRIDPETGTRREILNIRAHVAETNEAGMLGMALHPNMADSPSVFIVHTFWHADTILERLVRYEYDRQRDTLIRPKTLIDSIPGGLFRVGSRLAIAGDRTLYMTVGDAARIEEAQSHTSFCGKILRINLDGSVPADNPWATAPWPSCLLWSTGHRNPQGLAFGPDGTLYASEHGHDDDDELNIIYKGGNYGWPYAHGYCNDTTTAESMAHKKQFCLDSNVIEPIRTWNPTVGPAGIAYYGHTAIPQWHNSLLMVTLGKLKPELPRQSYSLVQFTLAENGRSTLTDTAYFEGEFGRLRGICVAPDGRVFISTSNNDGRASAAHGFPHPGDDRIIEITLNTSAVQRASRPAGFGIAPMPVRQEARITFRQEMGPGTIELFDEAGTLLRQESFPGGMEYRFRRNGLGTGTYFLRIGDGSHRLECPLVVQ